MMGQAVHGDNSDGVGLQGKKDDLAEWRMGHPRGGVKIFDKYCFSCVRGCLLKLFWMNVAIHIWSFMFDLFSIPWAFVNYNTVYTSQLANQRF